MKGGRSFQNELFSSFTLLFQKLDPVFLFRNIYLLPDLLGRGQALLYLLNLDIIIGSNAHGSHYTLECQLNLCAIHVLANQ